MTLRGRLTAMVGAILLGAIAAQGLIAYQAAKRATIAAAQVRLQSAADRLAELSSPGMAAALVRLARLAQDSVVRRALIDSGARGEARSRLAGLGPDTGLVAAVELRDQERRPVVFLDHTAPPGPVSLSVPPDSARVSPLFRRGDSVFFEIAAPVRRDDGVGGLLVQVRRVRASGSSLQILGNLIGPGATLLVGNADGSLWTDLTRIVDRPPPGPEGALYRRDGDRRVAAAARVAGTPLAFAVELPVSRALGAVDSLLGANVVIAALVVLLGTLAAWGLARTVSGPLSALTEATESVAAGHDLPAPLPSPRRDEIGRLARSFAVMAARVKEGRETLEHRVADRTAELAAALDQLRAAQEELVRQERLATLGQLSSSVGHELRNPLGVMTNAVYYLSATQPDAPPKVKEYLGIIRTQIQTAEKIVADLLDFARVRPPQRAALRLSSFLEDQLGRVTLPPTLEVVRDLEAGLPPVDVDPVQVGQVVVNLVINAVQAMEESGGVLTLRARAGDGRVEVEFADTGPGVAAEHLDRIFEPLFTTKARGIGLGLSVSRSLARANGGDLTARNGTQGGALFTLTLPATRIG